MKKRKIQFSDLDKSLVRILKKCYVSQKDLFVNDNHSDLYVGVNKIEHTAIISDHLGSLATIFRPQKGSDMEDYKFGIDIAFGAMVLDEPKEK